jgi:hypothetical protein
MIFVEVSTTKLPGGARAALFPAFGERHRKLGAVRRVVVEDKEELDKRSEVSSWSWPHFAVSIVRPTRLLTMLPTPLEMVMAQIP